MWREGAAKQSWGQENQGAKFQYSNLVVFSFSESDVDPQMLKADTFRLTLDNCPTNKNQKQNLPSWSRRTETENRTLLYLENFYLFNFLIVVTSHSLGFSCRFDSDSATDPESDPGFCSCGVGSSRFFNAGARRAVLFPVDAAIPPPAGPALSTSSSVLAAECDAEVTSSSRIIWRTRRTMLPMASSAQKITFETASPNSTG